MVEGAGLENRKSQDSGVRIPLPLPIFENKRFDFIVLHIY